MLNNIGYLAYISIMGILLLIHPSSFIKNGDQEQEQQSLINTQLQALLQTELGLRICGFYHLILLIAQILKQEKVKFICLNIYALFLISIISSLCIDGVGQIQSERLERLGFQAGIFSFIVFNNWPINKEKQESKNELKVVEDNNETQKSQKSEQNKEKQKNSENIGKEQKQGKKKGKAKNE